MIDVKSAVRAAIKYVDEFKEFIPSFGTRLEEVEYEDSGDWLITLSIQEEPFSAKREFKIFRIEPGTPIAGGGASRPVRDVVGGRVSAFRVV